MATVIILTLVALAVYDQVASPPIDKELLTALVILALTMLGYELDKLLAKWLNR